MLRSLFPFRRLLATTFLVVFVNVLVGQCWCATMKPAATPQPALAKAALPTKPAHAGCHGHGKPTAKQETKTKHAPKPAGKHDCCKDKSASLLSALTVPAEKHMFALAPAVLPVANEFHFRPATSKWDRTRAVTLVLPEHLPPKIPDIRIFIQSLTV
ncbi:MAG TPA: hypothetical protein VF629_23355 [Hymenobacter sp.]|jgi:hypothetical protein|uniref:hypothetical protein n=1 Tax=Hymenobacter sp. TaxID=1898978 RepID=UPI002ED90F4C